MIWSPLLAHGDLHQQIVAVSREIEKSPDDASLYLKRGELSRAHEAWEDAWADYGRAARLAPDLALVDRCRGLLLLERGKPADAKPYLDRYLRRCPDDGSGYLFRARALARTGAPGEAALDFTRAINRLDRPQPEHYLERARVQAARGPDHIATAIRGLDEGIEKLGSIVVLELAAADLETESKQYDSALARVDRIAARTPRKAEWLARQGAILELAGRRAEARTAYVTALEEIQSLPSARRNARATRELEERIRNALARLPETTAPAPERSEKGDVPCSGS